jgi:hypothetical protein
MTVVVLSPRVGDVSLVVPVEHPRPGGGVMHASKHG